MVLCDLTKARAYFLSSQAIAWKTMGDAASFSYFLYHDPNGMIVAKDGALQGGQAIPLSYAGPVSGDAKLATAFPSPRTSPPASAPRPGRRLRCG